MAAAVRIKVGAAMDQSFDAVMRTMQEAAGRASRVVGNAAKASGRVQASEADKAAKAVESSAKKASRAKEAEEKKASRAVEREARNNETIRDREANRAASKAEWLSRLEIKAAEAAARNKERAEERKSAAVQKNAMVVERELAREARASVRAAESEKKRAGQQAFREANRGQRGGGGVRGGTAPSPWGVNAWGYPGFDRKRAGDMALGGIIGVAGRAVDMGKDLARGAGIDFDMGGAIKQAGSMETMATSIANSAYMPGTTGPNGKRVDQKEIVAQARQVANETAYDPSQVLEGLQKFVAKTGDLDSGRAALKDLAVLSKATGTNLEDMVDAAGDVSNALGDTDDKGEKIKAVMTSIAAQGKLGAVEIKDLATQMAKLGAASGSFEGNTQDIMKKMGAFTQMSRAHGGSATATQAAQSLTGFANTFSKTQRLEQFKEFGVDIKSKKTGRTLDPVDIVLKSIASGASAKHGGISKLSENMGKMFKDTTASRATRGLEQEFMKQREIALKGGAKEEEAQKIAIEETRKEFEKLTAATMGQEEIQESFRRAMATSESQAQIMNNQFNEAASQLKDSLVPALISATPAIIAAVGAFAGIVEKFTGVKQAGVEKAEIKNQNELGNAKRAAAGEIKKNGTIEISKFNNLKELEKKQKEMIKAKAEEIKKNAGPGALEEAQHYTAMALDPMGTLLGSHSLEKNMESYSTINDTAKTKKQAESENLGRMISESEKTADLIKLIEGGIKVKVIEDQTKPAVPPPATGAGGVVGPS